MRTLGLIRHGSYDKDGLDGDGKKSIQQLGEELIQRPDFSGRVEIESSPLPRARETARILAKIFHVQMRTNDLLRTTSLPNIHAINALIQQHADADVLLLVSHHDVLGGYLNFLAQHTGNSELKDRLILMGRACLINQEDGTAEFTQ